MYMRRVHTKRNGRIFEYSQLVTSIRVGTQVYKKVLYNLGRSDDPHSLATYIRTQKNLSSFLINKTAKFYAFPTAIYMLCTKDLEFPGIFADIFTGLKITTDTTLLTILMIIHRIIDPDSKLSLTRWYKNILLPVVLPETLNVHALYYTLDYLIEKKEDIEQRLFKHLKGKGLIDATVVFYDLTSSYFEGEDVEMAKFGYSRDHRPDCLQITLGLVIDKHGLPVYHEVYEGNMADCKTVKGILEKLKTTFHLSNIIFVADKGMLTPDNLQELDEKKYQYILSESIRNALSQKTREELFLRKDTFTKCQGMEETLWYTTASDKEGKSIIVCYNQYTADKARQTRDTKLKKLEIFIAETKKKHKNETGKKVIQKVRDMIIAKLITSHARKYFDAKEKETIEALFLLSRDVITREEYMDGMWIIRSSTKDLTTGELIKTYKDLKTIEASFRTIKDVIELRPIYHHKDNRVKGHVFICILAFLVTRLLEQKTGQTIKMLKEEYMNAVAIPTNEKHPESQPIILGGNTLLQAVR